LFPATVQRNRGNILEDATRNERGCGVVTKSYMTAFDDREGGDGLKYFVFTPQNGKKKEMGEKEGGESCKKYYRGWVV